MKYIIAFIEEEKLGRVLQDLDLNEIYLKTISRSWGPAPAKPESDAAPLLMYRLEIAVNDNYVRPTLDAILGGARSGGGGAGKIFIEPLEQCIRIRTGDTGSLAIG